MVMLIFWSAGTVAASTRLKTLPSILIVACTLLSTVVLVQIPFSAQILKLAPLGLIDWATIYGWVVLFVTLQIFGNFLISEKAARRKLSAKEILMAPPPATSF